MVLICTSLMSDVEHLFIFLLAICMSSLTKCVYSGLFAHFLIDLAFIDNGLCELFIYF